MAQMQRENAKLKKKMIDLEKNAPLEEEDASANGNEEVGWEREIFKSYV